MFGWTFRWCRCRRCRCRCRGQESALCGHSCRRRRRRWLAADHPRRSGNGSFGHRPCPCPWKTLLQCHGENAFRLLLRKDQVCHNDGYGFRIFLFSLVVGCGATLDTPRDKREKEERDTPTMEAKETHTQTRKERVCYRRPKANNGALDGFCVAHGAHRRSDVQTFRAF